MGNALILRTLVLLAASSPFSCVVAAVTTGNLLVNPGGELGAAPWQLDFFGPTLLQNSPLSLPNGVAIVATEGTHWFGADVTYSKLAGQQGLISGNTASIYQTVDVRAYRNVESFTVRMDVTGAGMTLVGDSLAVVRPIIGLAYEDNSHSVLGSEAIGFGPGGSTFEIELQSGTATGLTGLGVTQTVTLPLGTSYIRAVFRMETGITAGTLAAASQVRVLAGIDNTFLSLTYTPVPGDYNLNGAVDAADYVVWRHSQLGSLVPAHSGADGNGNGVIDLDDYNFWRSQFGKTAASSSFVPITDSLTRVPEPAAVELVTLAEFGWISLRRRVSAGKAQV